VGEETKNRSHEQGYRTLRKFQSRERKEGKRASTERVGRERKKEYHASGPPLEKERLDQGHDAKGKRKVGRVRGLWTKKELA